MKKKEIKLKNLFDLKGYLDASNDYTLTENKVLVVDGDKVVEVKKVLIVPVDMYYNKTRDTEMCYTMEQHIKMGSKKEDLIFDHESLSITLHT